MVEILLYLSCSLINHLVPHVPLEGYLLPVAEAEVTLPQVGLDVILRDAFYPLAGHTAFALEGVCQTYGLPIAFKVG